MLLEPAWGGANFGPNFSPIAFLLYTSCISDIFIYEGNESLSYNDKEIKRHEHH